LHKIKANVSFIKNYKKHFGVKRFGDLLKAPWWHQMIPMLMDLAHSDDQGAGATTAALESRIAQALLPISLFGKLDLGGNTDLAVPSASRMLFRLLRCDAGSRLKELSLHKCGISGSSPSNAAMHYRHKYPI
jgi:hypothetical protein